MYKHDDKYFKLLDVSRIHSKRHRAIDSGEIWDFTSTGCAMTNEKILGNLRFLFQTKTRSVIKYFSETKLVNEAKLEKAITIHIEKEVGTIHLLRLAKFGLRELANSAEKNNYSNLYDYLKEAHSYFLIDHSISEISSVVPMTNIKFIELVKNDQCCPSIYYELLKYSLTTMLTIFLKSDLSETYLNRKS